MMEILHLRFPVCGDSEFSRERFFIFQTLIQPTFIKHVLCVMHCWCWGTTVLVFWWFFLFCFFVFVEKNVIFQGSNEFIFIIKWIHIIILLHLEANKCDVLTVINIHYKWRNCFSPFTVKSSSKVCKFEMHNETDENTTSF